MAEMDERLSIISQVYLNRQFPTRISTRIIFHKIDNLHKTNKTKKKNHKVMKKIISIITVLFGLLFAGLPLAWAARIDPGDLVNSNQQFPCNCIRNHVSRY